MTDKREVATKLKDEGNASFREGKVEEAIAAFTKGIQADDSWEVLRSNRSAVYLSAGKYEEALKDAEACIELKKDWPRGYQRKGAALEKLGRLEEAGAAYQAGLQQSPTDAACTKGLQNVQAQSGLMGLVGLLKNQELMEMVKASNKEVAEELQKAETVAKLEEIKQNPQLLAQHLGDAGVMKVINGLTVAMFEKSQPGAGGRGAYGAEAAERKKREEEETARKKREEEEAARKAEEERLVALKPEQIEAAAAKELGNDHFKAKKWDDALEQYQRARELDPENIVYLLNIAAVDLMQGQAEDCIKHCDEAVEEGRKNYASYELIAKALHRKGRAFLRLQNLEDAMKCFNESLMENRTAAALNDLRKTERALEARKKKEYEDPEKALEEKAKGNELFKNGDLPGAIKCFTEASKRNPRDHTIYSNRSLAYLRLGAQAEALSDAEMCIKLEPSFVKGYIRKAMVYFAQKQYHRCLDIYGEALKIDPDSVSAKEGMQKTVMAIQERRVSGKVDEVARQRALADPQIQRIMNTPEVANFLRELQQNPQAASEALSRKPALSEQINTLMAAKSLIISS